MWLCSLGEKARHNDTFYAIVVTKGSDKKVISLGVDRYSEAVERPSRDEIRFF